MLIEVAKFRSKGYKFQTQLLSEGKKKKPCKFIQKDISMILEQP